MVIYLFAPPGHRNGTDTYQQLCAFGSTERIFLSQLNNLFSRNSIFVHIHGKTEQNSCVF